jgi:hypothetical protein
MTQESALQRLDQILASPTHASEGELADRLSSVLSGIEFARTGSPRSNSGIFWGLTRVFGCYDRLSAVCDDYAINHEDHLTFAAELEIEHLLMRLRVLLDEVAYAIRILLPSNVRGLGGVKGPGPTKHFSMTELLKFTKKYPKHFPLLTHLLENNQSNIHRFIELRDDIAHFRAKAIIFPGDSLNVGFIGARNSNDEQNRVQHTELSEYFNDATIWMWNFLQIDVVDYFRGCVEDNDLAFAPVGIGLARISMPGLTRFKKFLDKTQQATPSV